MLGIRKIFDEIQPYRPGKRVSDYKRELDGADIVKLSSNESPFGPVEMASSAMADAISGLNRYPDGGSGSLKDKLSDRLGVTKDQLLVGNGSNELIRLISDALLDPGDEVIMADPSFIVYPLVVKLKQAKSVAVPVKNFVHDLEEMSAAVTARTKLIFVCNPNNPTGTVVDIEAVRSFLATVPKDVLVCVDEAYHEYVTDPGYLSALSLLDDYPNIIVLRTFSKIYGLAGSRIGYGAGPASIVETIDKIREPFNVNTIAQIGAYYSLDAEPEVAWRRDFNRQERDQIEALLASLELDHPPSQTNFVYFDSGMDAKSAFSRLLDRGVIVRALGSGRFLRATLGTAAENTRLCSALGVLR